VFVKGGAIIPMQPTLQHTGEKNDLLIIHVYAGINDSSFEFYEDDGSSFDYQNNRYAKRKIHYSPSGRKITLKANEGEYASKYKKVKVVLHGFDSNIKAMTINKENKNVVPEINSFFAGLEKYDPIKDPEPAPTENVLVAEFPYHASEIVLTW
jgi:alpha-glucosidase